MKLLLPILFPFMLLSQEPSRPKWIVDLEQSTEKNKAQHYWVSCIGTTGITWVLYEITDKPGLSSLIGGLAMFTIGWLKEDVYDGYMGKGVKSGGDKFMNGMGCVGGMMFGRVAIDIYEKKNYSVKELEAKKHILD